LCEATRRLHTTACKAYSVDHRIAELISLLPDHAVPRIFEDVELPVRGLQAIEIVLRDLVGGVYVIKLLLPLAYKERNGSRAV
jgi:hypothetical protein